jgi:hypothetical protein
MDEEEKDVIEDDLREELVDVAEREASWSPLRSMVETQRSVEKLRIQVGNRVGVLERGQDAAEEPVPEEYQRVLDRIMEIEADLDAAVVKQLRTYPVWDYWLRHVRGIGPSLAGKMLALLLPPIPTKGPSSWYKAAGLAPELRPDGQMRLPRPRAGEGKITYHPHLRAALYLVGTSFVRNGAYYRGIYEERKARLQQQHEGDKEWPKIRVDMVARWATVKLFLAHLYEAWCEVEGIERRMPYIVEYGQHHYIARPMPREDGKKI